MELIPKEHTIPTLYSTEDENDPLCQLKLFTPDAQRTWYIIEMDEHQELCFGYVIGLENELGYFTMHDLGSVRGALNLAVECDMSFTPTRLSQVKRVHHG